MRRQRWTVSAGKIWTTIKRRSGPVVVIYRRLRVPFVFQLRDVPFLLGNDFPVDSCFVSRRASGAAVMSESRDDAPDWPRPTADVSDLSIAID